MGRCLGDLNKKGIDNSLTKGYRMREALDSKVYLKFEENVIACLGKSVCQEKMCLFLVKFKNTDYVKKPVLSPDSSGNKILYASSGNCSCRAFQIYFILNAKCGHV